MEGLRHKLQAWSNAVKEGQLSFDEVVQILHPMLEQGVRVLLTRLMRGEGVRYRAVSSCATFRHG